LHLFPLSLRIYQLIMAAMPIKRSHLFKILYTFISCNFFDVVLSDSQNEPFYNIIHKKNVKLTCNRLWRPIWLRHQGFHTF
jgi:hypothetical protein